MVVVVMFLGLSGGGGAGYQRGAIALGRDLTRTMVMMVTAMAGTIDDRMWSAAD
jgi:hypothetical protein